MAKWYVRQCVPAIKRRSLHTHMHTLGTLRANDNDINIYNIHIYLFAWRVQCSFRSCVWANKSRLSFTLASSFGCYTRAMRDFGWIFSGHEFFFRLLCLFRLIILPLSSPAFRVCVCVSYQSCICEWSIQIRDSWHVFAFSSHENK